MTLSDKMRIKNILGLAFLAIACGLTIASFDNEAAPKPEGIEIGDVVVDDMIYGKEQFLKDYHNIRCVLISSYF